MKLLDFKSLPQGTIGVAVSGGLDSMCLLNALAQTKAPLVAITINHGLRPAAKQEVAFVQQICQNWGISCLCFTIDVLSYCQQTGVGTEQGARQLRYSVFDDLLAQKKVDVVATAHHQDDWCESILMNLFRGSGLRGLGGIGNRDGYWRPLLGVSRRELQQYAIENHIEYVIDESNSDTNFTRNWWRNILLPLIEQRYPGYRSVLTRTAMHVQQTSSLLDDLVVKPFWNHDVVVLSKAVFVQAPAMTMWSIELAFRQFNGGVNFTQTHAQQVCALYGAKNNTTLMLIEGVLAAKEYEEVVLWRKLNNLPDPMLFDITMNGYKVGNSTYRVRPYKTGDKLRFDADKIPPGAVIRMRQPGDTIAKFGGGTKSLGDYYTDNKVPVRLRNTYPVVALGSCVLVSMVDISANVQVDESTTKIWTFTEEE